MSKNQQLAEKKKKIEPEVTNFSLRLSNDSVCFENCISKKF